jgi:hypothetical protein
MRKRHIGGHETDRDGKALNDLDDERNRALNPEMRENVALERSSRNNRSGYSH